MKRFKEFFSKHLVIFVALLFLTGFALVVSSLLYADSASEPPVLCSRHKPLPENFDECKGTLPFFTGGAPLVSPPDGPGSVVVYIPGFNPTKSGQWKGHLYKYTLSPTGVMPESPDWDAGAELESKPYSDRNVFTVNWKGGNWKMAFDESNASTLAQMLESNASYLPSDQAPKFIRWVLGSDEWNEASGDERYKLGDIYHSGLVEVGPSKRIENGENREKIVYVQANDGMLHAFSADTGKEKWAFIPPNVLAEGRMVGMKQDISKNETVTWLDEAKSNPRYLLDGPLMVEDVLLSDGKYYTVLVGLLGYAGAGLYAMDVTDPDDPQFMWAAENAIYNRAGDKTISNNNYYVFYWSGGSSVILTKKSHGDIPDRSSLDYKNLSFTLSTPAVGNARISSNKTQGVVIMGNGSPIDVNAPSSTSDIYVIDIVDGKLLNSFDVGSQKHIVTPIAILGDQSTRLIHYFYVGDSNGLIYQGDLTSNSSSGWTISQIFSLTNAEGVSYIIEAAYIGNVKWLFVVMGDYDPLMKDNPNDFVVAIKIQKNKQGFEEGVKAWDMKIPAGEAITPPVYYNGYLFFTTYTPADPKNPCSVGTSHIYLLNATTGAGAWNGGGTKVDLPGVKVSGIVLSGDRVYAGVTKTTGADFSSLRNELGEGANVQTRTGLLVFDVPPEVKEHSPYPQGVIKPSYWRKPQL